MDYSARRSITLALRIHFSGRDGLKVSATTQDDIESLIPWLRKTLTSLRLPHPKIQNIIKPHEATSIIDMYWDVDLVRPTTVLSQVISRCQALEPSALKEASIGVLMVFELPVDMREIPSWNQPSVVRRSPLNDTTNAGPSGSRPHRVSTKLEVGLQALFENIGLSIPNPAEDVSVYIPLLSTHIQKLRSVAESEIAARMEAEAARVEAEAALAEERARHARILQDIQMECREPFVVPALLDAFLSVSHVVDSIPDFSGEPSRR